VIPTKNDIVPTLELRTLLYALKDSRPDICVRFRMIGEMWQTNYMRGAFFTENGAVFNDDLTQKFILVPDLNNVVQFELDTSFQQYQAHYHYSTDPSLIH
jgi:hypothetical protein